MSEADEQAAVVEYCRLRHIPIYHIPNEGKRSYQAGRYMKRQGLSAGVPDLCIPVPKGRYHSLYIEMKYGRFWSSDEMTGSQTIHLTPGRNREFWSSDEMTGSQTRPFGAMPNPQFWSSDNLTGSQMAASWSSASLWFWSSDNLTGSQTQAVAQNMDARFGAVIIWLVVKPTPPEDV